MFKLGSYSNYIFIPLNQNLCLQKPPNNFFTWGFLKHVSLVFQSGVLVSDILSAQNTLPIYPHGLLLHLLRDLAQNLSYQQVHPNYLISHPSSFPSSFCVPLSSMVLIPICHTVNAIRFVYCTCFLIFTDYCIPLAHVPGTCSYYISLQFKHLAHNYQRRNQPLNLGLWFKQEMIL